MKRGYFPMIVFTNNLKAQYTVIKQGLEKQTKKSYYQFILERIKKTYDDVIEKIKVYKMNKIEFNFFL